jgi:hypothetical protein
MIGPGWSLQGHLTRHRQPNKANGNDKGYRQEQPKDLDKSVPHVLLRGMPRLHVCPMDGRSQKNKNENPSECPGEGNQGSLQHRPVPSVAGALSGGAGARSSTLYWRSERSGEPFGGRIFRAGILESSPGPALEEADLKTSPRLWHLRAQEFNYSGEFLLQPIALVGDVTPYEALLCTGREISSICELPGHASGAVHDGITADPIDWRLHLFKAKAVSGCLERRVGWWKEPAYFRAITKEARNASVPFPSHSRRAARRWLTP